MPFALGPARRGKAGDPLIDIEKRREEGPQKARAMSGFSHGAGRQHCEPGD
jgi:hypothetical protein